MLTFRKQLRTFVYELNLIILVDLGQIKGQVKEQNVYFTGLNTGKELYIGETGNVNLDRFTGHKNGLITMC